MAISDKIKAAVALSGKSVGELASELGYSSPQAIYNKLNRESFSADDLIKIAMCVGGKLAITVGQTEIEFTQEDLRQ